MLTFRTRRPYSQVSRADDSAVNTDSTTARAAFHIVRVDPALQSNARSIILSVSVASQTTSEFIVFSRCSEICGIYEEPMRRERYYWCLLHVMELDQIADYRQIRERCITRVENYPDQGRALLCLALSLHAGSTTTSIEVSTSTPGEKYPVDRR